MSYAIDKARDLFLTLAMTLVLVGALLGVPAFAQDEGPWLVTEAQGDAWLKAPDGAKTPLQQGAEIEPGSVVGAGASGKATLSRGGTAMTLSPNSETEIPADSDQGSRTTIFQRLGTLLLKVDKRPEQHFEVDTPYLAAVVKGTTFTVSVDGEGSAVHVVEGAVEVGAFGSGEVAMVRPGQTARVSSQAGSGLKVSGLGAPAGNAGGNDQQGQNGSGEESGQAAAESAADTAQEGAAEARANAEQGGTKGGQQSAAAPAGKAKGLTLEQPIGWTSIDIGAVSDGFVAAVPAPGAKGLDQASAAGGKPAGTSGSNGKADSVDQAALNAGGKPGGNSGSTGNAVFGQSGGNGIAGIASAATAASSGAASTAGSAAAANSSGLGGTIQAAAAAVAAQNHGQAVSSVVKSLKGNGNNGNGNGNN